MFRFLFVLLCLLQSSAAFAAGHQDAVFAGGPGKNPKVRDVSMILQSGARPHFSPDGKTIVFDRKDTDGNYHLYLSDLQGHVLASLTQGNADVPQRNSGNGVFHPSGRYIVFIAEEPDHFGGKKTYFGDPGVGLYCNLWVMDVSTHQAWKLTDIPVKKGLFDPTPSVATVNPRFAPDGKTLLWTERYGEKRGSKWGTWRIKAASFVVAGGTPSLAHETVVFTPPRGNYVTLMGFTGHKRLLLAGNLDGQHEYGMDQYIYDIPAGTLTNLTNTPDFWEEDSNVFPAGRIIYMSNQDSPYKFNFENANWASQPMERDYYLMNLDGSRKERLTYFNDPAAPEYVGRRVLAVASDVSPDGSLVAATLGVDDGAAHRDVLLKVALIRVDLSR